MSDEPHLPGYSLEDDPHPHLHPSPPTQSPTIEQEGAAEPVPNVSDSTVTVVATTPPDDAQPQLLTQGQISVSPEPTEPPAFDEFSDPKIASLHAIFPGFDATIL